MVPDVCFVAIAAPRTAAMFPWLDRVSQEEDGIMTRWIIAFFADTASGE